MPDIDCLNSERRRFLKGSSAAALLPWLGTGLLLPTAATAAEWNKNAFASRQLAEAIKASGYNGGLETRDIIINAPEIAENGAKVEVEIISNLPNTRSLAVFAEKNPMPLAATLEFTGNVLPYARIQLKLSETMRLRVLAKTGEGKTHVAFREIKITLGGCGG